MKKTYIKPQIKTVVVIGPRLMLPGSNNNVTDYSHDDSDDTHIGDD